MKRLYVGILLITSFLCVSTQRAKRFSGNDQRNNNEWSWGRNEQLTDAQTKGSQANWPSTTNGGSTKGRGDAKPSRDGSWGADGWSSGENRNDGYDMGWNTQPQGNSKGSAYPDGEGEGGGNLETLLRGVPGMDFPDFVAVPDTDFDCSLMPSSQGYYGDVEAGCQVFHICQPGNRKDSFLCPVGTIFNQKYFVCDWWFNVNCNDTPSFYDLNNEVYKDPVPVTEEVVVPVTTEKTLPWNSQDLDKKRPTKSWGNQPSTGKQNPRWKDTPNRKGPKADTPATSREVSNSWSRSDVQKEVTVTWGASSGTAAGAFGSSSTSSSSFIPTTKPIWYGIDGQPAKDQSNGMAKRTGLAPTAAPFGTRMRSKSAAGRANTWAATEVYEQTTLPMRSSNYGTSTSRGWLKGDDTYSPSSTTRGWLKVTDIADTSSARNVDRHQDSNYGYPTTKSWLKGEDIPETSINPTGVKGVWEQETTRRVDQGDQTDTNAVGHKGFVTKSDNSGHNGRKIQTLTNQRKEWGQRQTYRNSHTSTATNRRWVKGNLEKQQLFENSNINDIPRRKRW